MYTEEQKKQFLEILRNKLGVIKLACEAFNVSRSTFYEWEKEGWFADEVRSIKEESIDFAEAALKKQISNGVVASTIFYLKTIGKDRGYSERHEITGANGKPIESKNTNSFDLSGLPDDVLEKLAELERNNDEQP